MDHALLKALSLSVFTFGAVLFLTPPAVRAATPTDLTVKATGASFKVGRLGRYTVTVANRGTQPTDDAIHLRVTLPAGLTFVAQSGSNWSCAAAGQSVDCVMQRSLDVGRTSTVRFRVSVCTAAFPGVETAFQVVYAADSNTGNNTATRSTVVRAGQCVQGTVTPRSTAGTPTATRTPSSAGTPTPTPVPGNPAAPVVTSFTCNGAAQCTVSTNESFLLRFSFTDANANAISWDILARRDDGFTRQVGRGNLGVPTGSATIPLQFPGFTCSFSQCRQDTWEFSLTVTDTSGLTSAPASVAITVLGN